MSGKMENHRERGVIKCFPRFSSKDATSSGTWVFRVECLDLLPESFRISVSGLCCCLDMLPKKYRFTSQPVGRDDNNNKGATHGGQRMSSGSGGGGGRDLIPVRCGTVVGCVAVWYEEQEVGGRLSSTCAPPPREHRPAFQSSVGQQLVSRSEQGL